MTKPDVRILSLQVANIINFFVVVIGWNTYFFIQKNGVTRLRGNIRHFVVH